MSTSDNQQRDSAITSRRVRLGPAREGASHKDNMQQLSELAASNGNLADSLDRLAASNTDLSGSNRDLTAANTSLTASNRDLASSNAGLSSNNRTLTTSNTELATSNDELSTSNTELTTSNSELEMFAHVMAHDLKEPIRGVRMLAQFIGEDDGTLNKASAGRLEQINQLCTRALTMIDVLLDAAQIGSAPLRTERVGVAELTADAMQGMMALIRDHGATITCEECGRETFVQVDRGQVARAVRNLMTNAVRYNSSDSKTVVVGVRQGVGAGGDTPTGVTITVTDNGPGISDEDAKTLFRMFRRLSTPVQAAGPFREPVVGAVPEGTGAGLAIVRKIVERHGGRVWVERRAGPETGSVFCMTLPRA